MKAIELPSPNHAARQSPVDVLVLHYTELPLDESLKILRDDKRPNRVSAHYVLAEDGTVYRLVSEDRVAWHAGRSYWRGRDALNGTSIGIEIVNLHGDRHDYPDVQIDALIELCRDIVSRHPAIVPRNVVGHSDIAPARKTDPGELFPWDRLARLQLALPKPKLSMRLLYDNPGAFYLALERFGYDIADGHAAVAAFQRRFRPNIIDGEIDGQCGALLFELLLERDMGRAR